MHGDCQEDAGLLSYVPLEQWVLDSDPIRKVRKLVDEAQTNQEQFLARSMLTTVVGLRLRSA